MRLEVLHDGRVAAAAFAWRRGEATHVTVIASAVFAIEPGGVALHRGAGVVRQGADWRDVVFHARCDVTLVGQARSTPGVVEPFVRLGVAADGRILLDKTVRVGGASMSRDGVAIDGLGSVARTATRRGNDTPAGEPIAVPDASEWSAAQSAPTDQQIPLSAGGEWLVLDGIDAHAPRVSTQLPSDAVESWVRVTHGAAAGVEERVPLRRDAIHVDVDARTITLTWRGAWALPRGAAVADCRFAAGLASPSTPVAWQDVWASLPTALRDGESTVDDTTQVGGGPLPGGVWRGPLPFVTPRHAVAAALHPEVLAPPVGDATLPGTHDAPGPVTPFPVRPAAVVAAPSSPPNLTALPWGGPVAAAPAARVGDETVALGATPPPAAASVELTERLREMAKDPAAIRKLMASLRSG